MQILVLAGVLLVGLGYIIVLFVQYVFNGIVSLIHLMRDEMVQDRYDNSLLGKIDFARKKVQSKIDDASKAITRLRSDQDKISKFLEYLKIHQKEEHSLNLQETILKQIILREKEIALLDNYIMLFNDCLPAIVKEKSDLDLLFEMVKFDQGGQNVDMYLNQFNSLQDRIADYSSYNFYNISEAAINSMNSEYKNIITGAALNHAIEIKAKQQVNLDYESLNLESNELSDDFQNLEQLVMDDFRKSVKDFEVLKKELQELLSARPN
ncbi:MAG: hypothetical protein ACRBG0_26610 [Lewinella sp.]|uniref:hypothetical protein n=1 Tax=Lewinella sp. TaxID=2004506 RepID=UPI003D6A5C7B